MQALFDTPRGHRVILCMPLRDFMASRLMRDQATVAMCTPGELVLAHLPAEPAAADRGLRGRHRVQREPRHA